VKKSKDQVSCSLNDEVAILNLERALYFGLDEVGAFVWQALSEPQQVSELCKAVFDRFEVDEVQCNADMLELLTELDEAGLIELVPSDALGDVQGR
jgi:hypothetical protein